MMDNQAKCPFAGNAQLGLQQWKHFLVSHISAIENDEKIADTDVSIMKNHPPIDGTTDMHEQLRVSFQSFFAMMLSSKISSFVISDVLRFPVLEGVRLRIVVEAMPWSRHWRNAQLSAKLLRWVMARLKGKTSYLVSKKY